MWVRACASVLQLFEMCARGTTARTAHRREYMALVLRTQTCARLCGCVSVECAVALAAGAWLCIPSLYCSLMHLALMHLSDWIEHKGTPGYRGTGEGSACRAASVDAIIHVW